MQSTTGLNLESVINQIQPGQLTYALNAMIEGFDGQSVTYQNEQGNTLCATFPDGYKVVGVKNVTSLEQVFYFLANPTTGHSMIGYTTLNSCVFNTLLDDTVPYSDLLGFDIAHPIFKIEVKTTNCSTQLYWTDKFNPRRFVDLNNLPWKDSIVAGIITPAVGQIDTNKLLVQPHFKVPTIHCSSINIGGNLVEGDYQFAIQYADVLGNGYTSYYSVTNKVRIFLDHKISPNFNELTNKSINVQIGNLDTSGLYQYFNLAVIKTINDIASVELVGTYYINSETHELTYTGTEQSLTNVKLTLTDIFTKAEYYDLAGDLTQVDNTLVWADLVKEEDISYQKIWNQVSVGWETWQVPYNHSEGYHNGANCANIQGFMRDEVYPLEGCFVLKNGKETTRGHIPGRAATLFDLQIISNDDISSATAGDACNPGTGSAERWRVYNTGSVDGVSPEFVAGDSCYKGPHMYGKMSYWESNETYPMNPAIWGSLSGKPIRHHKFPDSTIVHIHDQNPTSGDAYGTYEHVIYPIGFKVDVQSLWDAIQHSTDLTQAQKDDIVGFKVMRGDRVNNKSIVAKGLLYNCGKYTKETSSYYYPNYPFNDTNPDPYISSNPVGDKSGDNASSRLHDFQHNRLTFHSPDTSFYRPSGIQGSFLKLETVEYGHAKCHFVPVKDNAREKLRTEQDLLIAFTAAIASTVGIEAVFETTAGITGGVTTGVRPSINPNNFFPTYNNTLDILDKLCPYLNYGWQYNAVGYYGNYYAVPDTGNKVRGIEFGGYINPGFQGTFGDDHAINNSDRESAVYLSTSGPALPFAGNDNSRVTAGQMGVCGTSATFMREIASYYGAIKRYLPGQWGQIFSYGIVDTGAFWLFKDSTNTLQTSMPTVFGGDVFINRFALKRKHAFFTKTTVNHADGTDIDYNQDPDPVTGKQYTSTGNVGYPIWYYSTTNKQLNINQGQLHAGVVNLTNILSNAGLTALAILLGGLSILGSELQIIVGLITDVLLQSLGLKVTNMECADWTSGLYETGQAYLYAYGIPYYFCESEVNVDMRQATNIMEGNFYPQVSTDIPDDWLQQTNVPIAFDNFYVYNKTYSKQNKEHFYPVLRPDWTPNNPCWTVFNNRVIWSDKSSLEETKNNYLIYKPGNTNDLEKRYGKLQNIDNLANNQVLIRFDNKSQIYNVMTTIQPSAGPAAYVGNLEMFSTPPLDLSHTDIGNVGTQNSMLLKTDFGVVFCDAKRGEVALLEGTNVQNLEDAGVTKWFYQNLPFKILDYFPNIDIDNNFNGIGLHGTYDPYFSRIIITKKDYEPRDASIGWDGKNFYKITGSTPSETTTTTTTIPGELKCCPDGYVPNTLNENGPCIKFLDPPVYTDYVRCPDTTTTAITTVPGYDDRMIIDLNDPKYFCNKSWTISYSFKTKTWISFHSYIPDYYITYYSHFQSGKNDLGTSWDHGYTNTLFNTFYGITYPYILEYPYAYKMQDEILQNVKDFTTVRKYLDYLTFYEPDQTIYFNKSIIYNGQQNTGILNLVPKPQNNLSAYLTYPKFNTGSKDILVTKSDNFYNYNTFWDITINKEAPAWITGCSIDLEDKALNSANLDYTIRSHKKAQIRAKDVKIRHILDNKNDVRLVSKFVLAPTVPSYK